MPTTGMTLYGCDNDEATLAEQFAAELGIAPTITSEPISENNIGLVNGNRCISISHKAEVTHDLLHLLKEAGVTYISTRSAGYNHIDVDYAKSLGITVGNVMYSPDSVADYTLMLMLMAVRSAKTTILNANDHDFRLNSVRGKELRDMTIGVIGTGRIGTAVIERLEGFGCNIVAFDHRHDKVTTHYVPLNELLEQSDIVTLHIPLDSETRHILNRETIAKMKHGAFVINTGRGGLLHTEALAEGLESGKLGGVALDVIEGEEGIFYNNLRGKLIENKLLLWLQAQPNVIITPHTAYYTNHAQRDMVEHSIANCLKFEKENQAWTN